MNWCFKRRLSDCSFSWGWVTVMGTVITAVPFRSTVHSAPVKSTRQTSSHSNTHRKETSWAKTKSCGTNIYYRTAKNLQQRQYTFIEILLRSNFVMFFGVQQCSERTTLNLLTEVHIFGKKPIVPANVMFQHRFPLKINDLLKSNVWQTGPKFKTVAHITVLYWQ